MYHIAKNISPLNNAINNYITAFKSELVGLSTLEWKEEDLKGKSYSQWKVIQYYDLMYLLIIVYNEVIRTKNLNYSWSYYRDKFKLDKYRKCLECEGIDFDKALNAFGFSSYVNESGIELMEVETNFIIQKNELNLFNTTIKELLSNPTKCNNYIN